MGLLKNPACGTTRWVRRGALAGPTEERSVARVVVRMSRSASEAVVETRRPARGEGGISNGIPGVT